MIKINNNSISSVYDETIVIGKICKGTLKVYESWRNLIANGVPPLTLTKCKGVNLIDYKLYGDSVQDGTPTLETPIEVESVGDYDEETGKYKIPVKVSNGTDEVITNIYLNEPLRKIGDYADYIDFKNQKVVRNIYSYIVTGDENYYLCDSNAVRTLENIMPRIKLSIPSSTLFEAYLCSHNPFVKNSYVYLTTYSPYNPTSFEFRRIVQNWGCPAYTIDAWTTLLKSEFAKETPVTVEYVMENPIEETIELPNIPTFKGTTIIEVDTEVQPSNMEVVYKGK